MWEDGSETERTRRQGGEGSGGELQGVRGLRRKKGRERRIGGKGVGERDSMQLGGGRRTLGRVKKGTEGAKQGKEEVKEGEGKDGEEGLGRIFGRSSESLSL